MKLSWRSLSLAGPKGENQDSFLEPFSVRGEWWCAIADGVGGSHGGGYASQLCMEALRMFSSEADSMSYLFDETAKYLKSKLSERPNFPEMSTTLTVLNIAENIGRVGHVGDSRIYHIRGTGVMSRTHDQTEVQLLVDQGVLTKHQARRYPRRNVIISAMSPQEDFDLYSDNFEILNGDRIMLSTDGFHERISRGKIAAYSESCADFKDFWKALKDEIADVKLTDDATAVVMELHEQ